MALPRLWKGKKKKKKKKVSTLSSFADSKLGSHHRRMNLPLSKAIAWSSREWTQHPSLIVSISRRLLRHPSLRQERVWVPFKARSNTPENPAWHQRTSGRNKLRRRGASAADRHAYDHMAAFTLFPSLPTELRRSIWLEAVPDDEEEVCLPWPGDVPAHVVEDDPLSELPVLPLTVDTAFPVTMHVCRESRALTQDSRLSSVRFRASRLARCMTPFRRFRPDKDVLYLSHDSVYHLLLFTSPDSTKLAQTEPGSAARRCYDDLMRTLRATRRLAVNVALMSSHHDHIHEFLWEHVEASPERLAMVIPGTAPYAGPCKDPLGFVPPGKRCRLVAVPDAAHESVVVRAVDEHREPRAVSLGEAMRAARKELRDWCGGVPSYEATLDRLVVSAQVFVEYQKDGTWQEVCMQRMYEPHAHPGSREYVPLNRRPNPELVRVYDADFEFRPAAFERAGYR